ncbi:hypothetical protein SUGI_0084320 [Cryptomeria japonica]|nr:hypothetical protein SUGI_0084320 [Cryptomeria japonica]
MLESRDPKFTYSLMVGLLKLLLVIDSILEDTSARFTCTIAIHWSHREATFSYQDGEHTHLDSKGRGHPRGKVMNPNPVQAKNGNHSYPSLIAEVSD